MLGIILWSMFYIISSYLVQIVIHETGHLLFGLLTKYKLITFRIYCFAIIRGENGGFSVRNYHRSGSLGQCLMLAPEKENYPYKLITLGGILLNLLTAVMATIILVYQPHLLFVHRLGVILFAFYGYGFAFLNLIPFQNSGTMTDGRVLSVLSKNQFARTSNKIQLRVAQYLIYGKTYGELPLNLFHVPKGEDLTNPIIGYHKILESYYYMDYRLWDKVKECLDEFCPVMDKLPRWLKHTILIEEVFISIMQRDDTIKISNIYNGIKSYLKQSEGDYGTIRVRSAYEIFIKNIDKDMTIQKSKRFKENYLYPGEVRFCNSLLIELQG